MKKNNPAALWIIIAAVAVLAVGGWWYMNRSDDMTAETNVESTGTAGSEAESAENAGEPRSLSDLMAASEPMKCEFSDETDGSTTNGTVYVNDNKVRVDFTATSGEETMVGHVIMNNRTSYTWMDGQDEGYKLSITEEQQAEVENRAVDRDKKLDYECGGWSGDNSVFEIPGDVDFKDMGTVDTKAMQCAACDAAPEAGRAQCRAALGC